MKDRVSKRKTPKTSKAPKPVVDNQIVSEKEADNITTVITADNSSFDDIQKKGHTQDSDEKLRRSDHLKADAEDLTIPGQYEIAITDLIHDRYEKAEVIENKIEKLIEQQIIRIKLHTNQKPNKFLSLPSQKKEWNRTHQKQQATLERLKERLRIVHEIKEKVTHEGPQLELLAQRKLQFQNPSLVSSFVKDREKERKKKLTRKESNIYQRSHNRTLKRGLKHKLR